MFTENAYDLLQYIHTEEPARLLIQILHRNKKVYYNKFMFKSFSI
jgi:hypothetical protein